MRSAERISAPERSAGHRLPRTIRWATRCLLAIWVALGISLGTHGYPSPSQAQAPPAAETTASGVEPKTNLADIEDEVMCPVCGTTLELASDNRQAVDQRNFIRELAAEGRTKDEIKDALVAEFGEEVLALPSTEGFDLAAWVIPVLAVIAGASGVFLGLRRWRAAGARRSAEPRSTEAAPDADERKRLDADLERYGP